MNQPDEKPHAGEPSRGWASDQAASQVADQVDAIRKIKELPPMTGRPSAKKA